MNILVKEHSRNKIDYYPQFMIQNYTTNQLLGIYYKEQLEEKNQQFKLQFRPRRHQQRPINLQSFKYVNLLEEQCHSRYMSTVSVVLDSVETTGELEKQESIVQIPEWIIKKLQIENLFGQWLNNNCSVINKKNYSLASETLLWALNLLISYSKNQLYISNILNLINQIYEENISDYIAHRVIFILGQRDIVLSGDLINIYLKIQNNIKIDQNKIFDLQQEIEKQVKEYYNDYNMEDDIWINYLIQQQQLLTNILPQIVLDKQSRELFYYLILQKDNIDIHQQLKTYLLQKDVKNQFLSLSLHKSYNQENSQFKQLIEDIIIKDFKELIQQKNQSKIKEELIKQFYETFPQLKTMFEKYQQMIEKQYKIYLQLFDVDKILINNKQFQISQIQDIQTLIIPDELMQLFPYDKIQLYFTDIYSNKLQVETEGQVQNCIQYRVKLQTQQTQNLYYLLFKITLINSQTNQTYDILNVENPQFLLKQVKEGIETSIIKHEDLMYSQIDYYKQKPNFIVHFSLKKPPFSIQYLNNPSNTCYQYTIMNLCFLMKFQFKGNNEIKLSIKNCEVYKIQIFFQDDWMETTAQIKTNLTQQIFDSQGYSYKEIEKDKFYQLQGRIFYFIIQSVTHKDDINIEFTIKNQDKLTVKNVLLKNQQLVDVNYRFLNDKINFQYENLNQNSNCKIQGAKLFINSNLQEFEQKFEVLKETIKDKTQNIRILYQFTDTNIDYQIPDEIRYQLESIQRYGEINIQQPLIFYEFKQLLSTQVQQLKPYQFQVLVKDIQDSQIIQIQQRTYVLCRLLEQKQINNNLLLTYEIMFMKPGYYEYPKLIQQGITTEGCNTQRSIYIKVVE